MAFVIRLATERDISHLNLLIHESVRALSTNYSTPRQIESTLKYIFGVDSQLIDDGAYYVVEADATIAGCGGWSKRNTLYRGGQMKAEADPLFDPAHDAARIRAFFVDPAWTRQGISRQITEQCEVAARSDGFRRMELGATLPGEPLYSAMGYVSNDRFNIEMPDGEALPCAQMVKSMEKI